MHVVLRPIDRLELVGNTRSHTGLSARMEPDRRLLGWGRDRDLLVAEDMISDGP